MAARDRRYRARYQGIVRPPGVDPDAIKRVLQVPPEVSGMRLDRFVQSQLRATSRNRSQLIVAQAAYTPEGQPLRKNHRLQSGERVVLWRLAWDDLPDEELQIVYEDDDLVAINKPPFMVVHPTARHHRSTVAMVMAAQRPDERVTLVHRLDRETSGVLLMARTRAADRAVKIQFEERKDVVKRYLAISWGSPVWQEHTCEKGIEPDLDSRYRVKMRAVDLGGLPSATTFEVLGVRGRSDHRYTLLRCTLHSGRQHQIRVHLSALGLPIVGDKLYGPDETLHARGADGELTDADLELLELDRQALHASELVIDQPSSGERLRLAAPLYPDLAAFWEELDAV